MYFMYFIHSYVHLPRFLSWFLFATKALGRCGEKGIVLHVARQWFGIEQAGGRFDRTGLFGTGRNGPVDVVVRGVKSTLIREYRKEKKQNRFTEVNMVTQQQFELHLPGTFG